MLKKIFSLVLVLGIVCYSPLAVFAASEQEETDGFTVEDYIEGNEAAFFAEAKEELGLVTQAAVDEQAERDIALLQSFYQPTDNITAIEVGENALRYTVVLPGAGILTRVEVCELGNGTRTMEVWEGECHDFIAILNNGPLY